MHDSFVSTLLHEVASTKPYQRNVRCVSCLFRGVNTPCLCYPQMNTQRELPCRELPGELEKIMVWFRDYKIPDGKKANAYGFDSKPVNKAYAHDIVDETHEAYKQLRVGARKSETDLCLR